jgi:antitoxin (DNA-binding transcriptional repressor) of toxin-antitoxin stability system
MTIEDARVTEAVLEINVTDFKARCLALFKELEARRYDRLVVTRRGKPIAQLTPAVSEVPDP